MKISYNKNVSSLDEKKLNNKNTSLRIHIYFDWMKIYFGITYLFDRNLFWLNKNI